MYSRVRSSSHSTSRRPRRVAMTWGRQQGPKELPGPPREDGRFTATSAGAPRRMHSVVSETHMVRRSPAHPPVRLGLTGFGMPHFLAAGFGPRPTSGMHSACSHHLAPHGSADTVCLRARDHVYVCSRRFTTCVSLLALQEDVLCPTASPHPVHRRCAARAASSDVVFCSHTWPAAPPTPRRARVLVPH